MNSYNVVMGIEIHLEMLTKTKMFSPSLVKFGAKPNTAVDPVVLAYPGSMPQVNKQGVIQAIKACHLLNLQIDPKLRFDRKHYYYHDLPKGFQITQHYHPLGLDGKIVINDKVINIQRAHIEEDTAKTITKNGQLLIDYNRCGNPLLEIVTDPDFDNATDVVEYINTIKQLMFYANISKAKMEQGSLRCDINISLHKKGASKMGQKVEIKNLNSTANVKKAIEYEIVRQSKLLNEAKVVLPETRKFNEATSTTNVMRLKDKILDYRYIRESNIATIFLNDQFIKDALVLIQFNAIKFKTMLAKHDFTKKQIDQIINQFDLKDYIVGFLSYNKNINIYFKVLLNDLKPIIKTVKINHLKTKKYIEFIDYIVNHNISNNIYKNILKDLVVNNISLAKAIEKNKIDYIDDEKLIIDLIEKCLTETLVKQYITRPKRVEKQIMGYIMKETQGKANPVLAMNLIKKKIK